MFKRESNIEGTWRFQNLAEIQVISMFSSSRSTGTTKSLLVLLLVGAEFSVGFPKLLPDAFKCSFFRWCEAIWTARVLCWQNPLPHKSHLKGFSSAWIYLKIWCKNYSRIDCILFYPNFGISSIYTSNFRLSSFGSAVEKNDAKMSSWRPL